MSGCVLSHGLHSSLCFHVCRNPRDYFAIFDKAEVVSADGSSSEHFELINCKCVDTYVTVKKNQNQICWKFRKVRAEACKASSNKLA